MVLENFEYNGNHFIQTDGKVIGSKLGKTLGLYIHAYILSFYTLQPYIYITRDSLMMALAYGRIVNTLQNFTEYANKIQPKIKIRNIA